MSRLILTVGKVESIFNVGRCQQLIDLQILVDYLKKEGWNIMTATNGIKEVETFQVNPGRFAAVIIGIQNSIYLNKF